MFDFRLPIECDRVHTALAEATDRQRARSLFFVLRGILFVPRNSRCRGYSQAIPSPSRSRWDPYPGSPLRTGAAPASRAAVQFSKKLDEPELEELLDDPLDEEPDPDAPDPDPDVPELEDF